MVVFLVSNMKEVLMKDQPIMMYSLAGSQKQNLVPHFGFGSLVVD